MTGEAFDGTWFTDDPACDSAAYYCREAAAELGRPFAMRPIATDTTPKPSDSANNEGTGQVNIPLCDKP